MRRQELLSRFRDLHHAVARLLEALPPNDRFESNIGIAIEALAAALLPPIPHPLGDDVWRLRLDPTRHVRYGALKTFAEAGQARRGSLALNRAVWRWDPLRFGPGLVYVPDGYASTLVSLLGELEERVTPGRVVDGPIMGDDAFSRLALAEAVNLLRAAGRPAAGFPVWPPIPDSPRADLLLQAGSGRAEVKEILARWERLSDHASRVVELLLPAGHAPEADEQLRTVAGLLCPPARASGFDPARHLFLAGPPSDDVAGDPDRRLFTFAEAVPLAERHVAAGWDAERRLSADTLSLHEPPFVGISTQRAEVVAGLLTELAARVRPGCVVEGPILDDNSYRRFVVRIAGDLSFRSGGAVGPRDWDSEVSYYP